MEQCIIMYLYQYQKLKSPVIIKRPEHGGYRKDFLMAALDSLHRWVFETEDWKM
jgi:hypothetical protein